MKTEEKLFDFIRRKVPETVSFIDEIAEVLDVNYDAAYRRVTGKTTLGFSDALKLMKKYNFSIDEVFSDKNDFIRVTKAEGVNSVDKLGEYFSIATSELQTINKFQKSDIFYSAKDIPVYYSKGVFRKFKMYSFLNVLADQFNFKRVTFEDFDKEQILVSKLKKLEDVYETVSTVEIWCKDTITSTVNQILYFFRIGLLEKEQAALVVDDFYKTIQKIENQCATGKRGDNDKTFRLYNNELLNLNNTIFMRGEKEQKLFVPYTTLSYIKITDEETCDEVERYLKKQLQFSKELGGDTELERTIFFNSLYKRINKLKELILLE